MNRETARQAVRGEWRLILGSISKPARTKVNGEQTYICPLCGNGKGESGDGITRNPRSKDGNGLKCFKCGFSGDIIDLYTEFVPGYDFNKSLSELAEFYLHETIEDGTIEDGTAARDPGNRSGGGISSRPQDKTKPETAESCSDLPQNRFQVNEGAFIPSTAKNAPQGEILGDAGNLDFSAYFKECRRRLDDARAASYLSARGISQGREVTNQRNRSVKNSPVAFRDWRNSLAIRSQ